MQYQTLQGCQSYLENESNEYNKINQFDMNENESTTNSVPQKVHGTLYYEITSDKSFMKYTKYNIMKDNQVIYTAKVKDDGIYIEEATDFNNSDIQMKNTAKITRGKSYNIVKTADQEFKINFIQIGEFNSLNVSFNHNGKQLNWIPRQPRSKIGLHGGYGRAPIQSKKNTMLQNLNHRPSFICRQMSKKVFEAECNKDIDPRIVFAIALSQIIGPLLK